MIRRILTISLLLASEVYAQTATQNVLSYTAANAVNCTVEVSTSASFSPAVLAVDSTIFANANSDGQTNIGARQFLVGRKWIAQENVSPPAITVAIGNASRTGTTVTVTFTSHPFVIGDNIAITGQAGDTALEDAWARVGSTTTNTFTYITIASGTASNAAALTVTRANRYSLALAANTTYFYRLGGVSNTCGASPATGSFTTMNIPNGNTWEEGPIVDSTGVQLEPTLVESRTFNFVDPLTGGKIQRVSLYLDAGGAMAAGWSSSFYRSCSLTTSANGFYHCWVGMGSSGSGGFYSIKSTGETHWLGLMKHNYIDSNGIHCCNQTINPYVTGNSSVGDTSNANLFYGLQGTNSGAVPYKNVVVSTTFTGNDAVDVASGVNWTTGTSTALTPDPSNTLDDKMAAFAAADLNYNIARFHGCVGVEAYDTYLTGNCNSFDQGSPAVMFAFNTSTNAVAAMGLVHENPQTRWCGSHGTVVDESVQWIGFGASTLQGNQTGEWHVQLSSAVTNSATSFSVTSPKWLANSAYSISAVAGTAIIDTNNNLEVSTTAGTSGGSQPTWNATPGGTTSDNTVTWTNEGAAQNVGEPQNIYAFKDSSSNYYSFLMSVAGATGSGGEFNGDLFHFEDGTNECVRLVTKGSVSGGVATWTVVTRAVSGNSLVSCVATASVHAAGASLRCLCEEAQEASARSSHYWDFVNDPHMTDTTNTTYVRLNSGSGHGYAREPAPNGGIFSTFGTYNTHNPFVAADFTGQLSLIVYPFLTFNGLATGPTGVAHQDYTTWNFDAASFKNSAIGSLFFVTGGGAGGYGTYALVNATTTIYKYTIGNAAFSRTLTYVPTSGGAGLPDISGPGSLLTDTGANQVCIVVVAGECWAGSAPGEIYASLSQPVVGTICNNGNENASFLGHDWCMMNTSMYGDALNQYGLLPANFLGNDSHGVPRYGAGLSRRLAQNALGGMRVQTLHPHTVPDGSMALFESCIGDPHVAVNGPAVDQRGCQVLAAFIPPQSPVDSIDRTNYLNVPIVVGSVGTGASYAVLEYGYEENEPARGTTFPPTINYYCMQYKGSCFWSGTTAAPVYSVSSGVHLPLLATATLPIGVPQRVLAYNLLYFNGSNAQVGSSGLRFISTDNAAVVATVGNSKGMTF